MTYSSNVQNYFRYLIGSRLFRVELDKCLLFNLENSSSDILFMLFLSFCGPYVMVNMELPSGICSFALFKSSDQSFFFS